MNINNLVNRSITDDDEALKASGKYFNFSQKYGKNYQIEVGRAYFEIFDNEGKPVVSFATKDIINILKEKKIIQ
jgi:hypothetical protein